MAAWRNLAEILMLLLDLYVYTRQSLHQEFDKKVEKN
jgi:hypothetical protein